MRAFSNLVLFLIVGVLSACGPVYYSIPVEMRYPSTSGLDIVGKSIGVVYLNNGKKVDTTLNKAITEEFCAGLDEKLYNNENHIDIYKMKGRKGGDYSNKDTLVNLIMDTQKDVIFLFDTPKIQNINISDPQKDVYGVLECNVFIPYYQNVYVYDSMSKKDKVYKLSVNDNINFSIVVPRKYDANTMSSFVIQELSKKVKSLGLKENKMFLPKWKKEEYTIFYYDYYSVWTDAAKYAYDMKWKKAMSIWMNLINSADVVKRVCAEYNIGLASYMLGDNKLANSWLKEAYKNAVMYKVDSFIIKEILKLQKKVEQRMNL